MKILIVDANRVYARKIQEFICGHVKEHVAVDVADNVFVLQDRLATNKYDFILADVTQAWHPGQMADILKKCKVPQLLWSMTGTDHPKPQQADQFEKALSPVLTGKAAC